LYNKYLSNVYEMLYNNDIANSIDYRLSAS
jgi:hypothetical protein